MPPPCPGYRFAAVSCGIKKRRALDLGLLTSDRRAAGAALFTRNRVKAAPVEASRAALARSGGVVRAIVVNSGNANACTGSRGRADARAMREVAAQALGIPVGEILVASTGVIGVPLPMEHVERGIRAAAKRLRGDGFGRFARGILTTDRRAKVAHRRVVLGGAKITLLGCTKGAGMIAPNLATTLTFLVTDARIAPSVLDAALRAAVESTFNAITIDGDTSTNDMIAITANGAAANRPLSRGDILRFGDVLTDLCSELAHRLMRDGEGVHHVVTIWVRGARSQADARKVARTIAESPLVKTAIAGADPNWGRFLCAAGNAGVALRPERLRLAVDAVQVAANGVAAAGRDIERRAQAVMRRSEYTATLDLGLGPAEACCLACDLSSDYVTINADYRS